MKKNERVVVIGLDGASLELIKRWTWEGRLPTLRKLIEEGVYGHMRSSPDHSSPAAWTSFSTGKNPGKHGIYNFLDLVPNTFKVQFFNSNNRDGETIWSLLNQYGKKVGICNIPMTYPADEVNGFMISGWNAPTIKSKGFTYPPELIDKLLRKFGDYPLFPTVKKYIVEGRPDLAVEELNRHVDITGSTTKYLIEAKDWDFFTSVFVATDQAQHYFWHYMDPAHPQHDTTKSAIYGNTILNIYKRCDEIIGEILDILDEDTTLIIMSDHGSGPNHGAVQFLPALLKSFGLLYENKPSFTIHSKTPWESIAYYFSIFMRESYQLVNKRLGMRWKQNLTKLFPALRNKIESTWRFSAYDWSKTKVYFHFQPRINLKGREPHGIIHAGREYEELRDYIIDKLYECRDLKTGRKVVERIFKREEVYSGKYFENAPDIVIWWKEGVVISGLICKADDGSEIIVNEKYEEDYRTGNHTPYGIFIAKGKNITAGKEIKGVEIIDLAPTILYLMGMPILEDMDGRVLTEIFKADFLQENRINYAKGEDMYHKIHKGDGYSESETEQVKDHLKGLGYLD